MFDLWGEAAPAPLTDLGLGDFEIPEKEKRAWEKELMGISPLEQPFSPRPGWGGAETVFCGQVTPELDGRNVAVAGRVTAARHLTTRKNQPFARVVLADVSGQVDIIVWSRVYAGTEGLWQEDSELAVWGRVQMRDDQVQINCDRVSRYSEGAAGEEGAPESRQETEPVVPAGEVPAVRSGRETAEEPAKEGWPGSGARVVVSISQTGDLEGDKVRVQNLMAVLKEFPGRGAVDLRFTSNGARLRVPNVNTGLELYERLMELVGEAGVCLEPVESI